MNRLNVFIFALTILMIGLSQGALADTAVTFTIATQPQQFPAGTVAGNWRYEVLDTTGANVLYTWEVTATTLQESLPDGDYQIRVSRLDGNGLVLAQLNSKPFTVTAPQPVTIDVPFDVTVTPVTQ